MGEEQIRVVDNRAELRYELWVDGAVAGFIAYRREPATVVPRQHEPADQPALPDPDQARARRLLSPDPDRRRPQERPALLHTRPAVTAAARDTAW